MCQKTFNYGNFLHAEGIGVDCGRERTWPKSRQKKWCGQVPGVQHSLDEHTLSFQLTMDEDTLAASSSGVNLPCDAEAASVLERVLERVIPASVLERVL